MVDVAIEDMKTPLEECIARDSLRPDSVGEKVIRKLYDKWCPSPIQEHRDDAQANK